MKIAEHVESSTAITLYDTYKMTFNSRSNAHRDLRTIAFPSISYVENWSMPANCAQSLKVPHGFETNKSKDWIDDQRCRKAKSFDSDQEGMSSGNFYPPQVKQCFDEPRAKTVAVHGVSVLKEDEKERRPKLKDAWRCFQMAWVDGSFSVFINS